MRTAYRESAPPAQCARCGTEHAAAGHALCVACARRERRRDRRALGLVALALATAGGAVVIVRQEPRAFPRPSATAARDDAPPDESVATPQPAAAAPASDDARAGAIERTLAVLDHDADDSDPRADGAATPPPLAVLVVRARACTGEPAATPCRELALLAPDGEVRWHAPLSSRARVAALDGVVMVAELLHVTGRSVATGGVRWERELGLIDEPLAAAGAEHTFVVTDGARLRAFAPEDGSPRFDLAVPNPHEPPTPRPAGAPARARLRMSLEPSRGALVAVDVYGPGQAAVLLAGAASPLAPDEARDVWIGAGGVRLRAVFEPDEVAARFEPARAPRTPHAGAAAAALHITRDDGATARVVADLGTGHWDAPAVDSAVPTAPVAFRDDAAGTVYALAARPAEVVLVALRAPALDVQWSRRVALDPAVAGANAAREPMPVDFAAAPRALVLALDGGRRLAWIDPRSGALLRPAPGIELR